jgi:hypothetical protein
MVKSENIQNRHVLIANDLICHADTVLKSSYESTEELEQAATLLLQVTENTEDIIHALQSWIPLESAFSTIQGKQQPTSMLHGAFLRLISKALAMNSSLSIILARRAHSLDMGLTLSLYHGLLEAAVKTENLTTDDRKREGKFKRGNTKNKKPKVLGTIQEFASAATKLLDITLDSQFFAGAIIALVEQGCFYETNKLLTVMTKQYGVLELSRDLMMTLLEMLHRELETAKGFKIIDAMELFYTLQSLSDDDDDQSIEDDSSLKESYDFGEPIDVNRHDENSTQGFVKTTNNIMDTSRVQKSTLLNDISNFMDTVKSKDDAERGMGHIVFFISIKDPSAVSTSNPEEDDSDLDINFHEANNSSYLTKVLYTRNKSTLNFPDVTEQFMKFSETPVHRYSFEFESLLYFEILNNDSDQ